jgi:5'-nucleotidase/UDP-sugar diphosphatase
MKTLTFLGLWLALFYFSPLEAKKIQILHTNDLHSMFNGSRDGLGGYARLKTLVKVLKAKAQDDNIPTLFLDGGDFSEGSSFYFSNQGNDSFRALDLLGVDVTVLGNHDFLLGPGELIRQIKNSKLKAKIISGNLKRKKSLGLDQFIQDHVDYKIDDLKLRIMGVTTSEIIYQYPLLPLGYMADSHKTGIKMSQRARNDRIDFLIALTHVGLKKDIKLARQSRSIDLIIGGHDHKLTRTPVMINNLKKRPIPIIQAGGHSKHLGALLIDIRPKGESVILDYQVYDIAPEIEQDAEMNELVKQADLNRKEYFGPDWDKIIGISNIQLTGAPYTEKNRFRSCWSRHIARLTRLTANADLGIQFDEFLGQDIAPGEITYKDIIDNFPRFNKWGDKGWMIKKTWIQGLALKKIIKVISQSDMSSTVTMDGLQVNLPNQLKINGLPIQNFRFYSVAMPSIIPRAIFRTVGVFGNLVFRNPKTIPHSHFWTILETYLATNSPLECLEN